MEEPRKVLTTQPLLAEVGGVTPDSKPGSLTRFVVGQVVRVSRVSRGAEAMMGRRAER